MENVTDYNVAVRTIKARYINVTVYPKDEYIKKYIWMD